MPTRCLHRQTPLRNERLAASLLLREVRRRVPHVASLDADGHVSYIRYSEIDILIEDGEYFVFVEAKHGKVKFERRSGAPASTSCASTRKAGFWKN